MTPEMLKACTGARIDRARTHAKYITAAMDEFGINTPLRQAAFLAQVAHECGKFAFPSEIWGPTEQQLKYEPPSELATKLGNTQPGDGSKYRGHGWIQVTGRFNHREMGLYFGIDAENNPTILSEPEWAARTAGRFWKSRGLNELADTSSFVTITRRINGGTRGLKERQALYAQAKAALGIE